MIWNSFVRALAEAFYILQILHNIARHRQTSMLRMWEENCAIMFYACLCSQICFLIAYSEQRGEAVLARDRARLWSLSNGCWLQKHHTLKGWNSGHMCTWSPGKWWYEIKYEIRINLTIKRLKQRTRSVENGAEWQVYTREVCMCTVELVTARIISAIIW